MPNVPTLLTVAEAHARIKAAGIEVSEDAVRRWARTGKVPARRIIGRFYFNDTDIDALIVDAPLIGNGAA